MRRADRMEDGLLFRPSRGRGQTRARCVASHGPRIDQPAVEVGIVGQVEKANIAGFARCGVSHGGRSSGSSSRLRVTLEKPLISADLRGLSRIAEIKRGPGIAPGHVPVPRESQPIATVFIFGFLRRSRPLEIGEPRKTLSSFLKLQRSVETDQNACHWAARRSKFARRNGANCAATRRTLAMRRARLVTHVWHGPPVSITPKFAWRDCIL